MKLTVVFALFTCASSSRVDDTPVTKVVGLIEDLKTKVETAGQDEQKAYDKYACFCEDTLNGKAADMTLAKGTIEDLTTLITKLGGDLASSTVEIKQLKE